MDYCIKPGQFPEQAEIIKWADKLKETKGIEIGWEDLVELAYNVSKYRVDMSTNFANRLATIESRFANLEVDYKDYKTETTYKSTKIMESISRLEVLMKNS